MKKVLLVLMALLICSTSAFAEATFDQIQGLIKAHDYAPAVQGLQLIIQNHPKSAKAYYAMSQAQAGLGNQIKAKEALDMATGIDPSLKFASSGNVEKLKDAIQPQTKKIEAIESHTVRNCLVLLLVVGVVCFFIFRRKKKEIPPVQRYKEDPDKKDPHESASRQSSARSYESLSPYRTAPHHNPSPSYPPMPSPVQHMTVVNNGGGSDLITGIVLGEMMAGSHGHRETVVEREYVREEVIREIPAPSRSSSWDEKPSSSSTWDDGGSPSSSSWDSGSSSSSSSWDSGSSDSSSSSSWDD